MWSGNEMGQKKGTGYASVFLDLGEYSPSLWASPIAIVPFHDKELPFCQRFQF